MPTRNQQLTIHTRHALTLRDCPVCRYPRGVVRGLFVDHPDRNTLVVDKRGRTKGKPCRMSGKAAGTVGVRG